MAMVRDPTPTLCCYDEAFIDDVGHTGDEHENLLHHPWELPMTAGSSGTFAQDGDWANMAGVSSSSPSSSSVVTFDSHGGDEYCAAWTDGLDQLISYDLELAVAAPGHAAASTVASNSFSFGGDSGGRDVSGASASQKRPRARAPTQGAEEEAAAAAPPPKKQGGGHRRAAAKPNKAPPTAMAPKDPQNLAAKNRRERITERLRALQELVPNGSKVDTVTMLDKAITYVKFMQLQLKVLQTDAFWPAPGGEAPGMSQVKEALDAILLSAPFSSSQR
ncbi:Transcription factor bHLH83 [Panicum miliaceum]|uniref:Transcription factor bHLH83 n=1 Tax=Panicum miliaceum TaxID=4540 RepID=A0A3L6RX79_PANMI|nr:Transcription factor bHLH83 [Panicum miliaceum]